MAVTVTTHRKPDDRPVTVEHPKGRSFRVEDGHLTVGFDSMTDIAVYAPGKWENAVLDVEAG